MAKAFADGLEVSAAPEEPIGVGVAQVVDADPVGDSGGGEGGIPDAFSGTSGGRRAGGLARG
ncbi:hypothetical protein JOD54_006196 [Actinokineospora baliensis]|nr:hypothetical protein [Actinokineospora baliensis]